MGPQMVVKVQFDWLSKPPISRGEDSATKANTRQGFLLRSPPRLDLSTRRVAKGLENLALKYVVTASAHSGLQPVVSGSKAGQARTQTLRASLQALSSQQQQQCDPCTQVPCPSSNESACKVAEHGQPESVMDPHYWAHSPRGAASSQMEGKLDRSPIATAVFRPMTIATTAVRPAIQDAVILPFKTTSESKMRRVSMCRRKFRRAGQTHQLLDLQTVRMGSSGVSRDSQTGISRNARGGSRTRSIVGA
jgi:membrane protease subunit (stomatin/prohibitin family)